jgi:hypothetical protein
MAFVHRRVFALDVDGRPTLVFEARNQMEARELCREAWLRCDLTSQKSDGVPLCGPKSKLSVRLAEAEEARLFGEAAKAAANPSDDLVLAYLVELDTQE